MLGGAPTARPRPLVSDVKLPACSEHPDGHSHADGRPPGGGRRPGILRAPGARPLPLPMCATLA